jgi:single-stranded DNA-binding protein
MLLPAPWSKRHITCHSKRARNNIKKIRKKECPKMKVVSMQGNLVNIQKRKKDVITFSLACYGGETFKKETKERIMLNRWQNCIIFSDHKQVQLQAQAINKGTSIEVTGYLKSKLPYTAKNGKTYSEPDLIVEGITLSSIS